MAPDLRDTRSPKWILSFRVQHHAVRDRLIFVDYTPWKYHVVLPNNTAMKVHGYGRVDIKARVDGQRKESIDLYALHIPTLPWNLFSVQQHCREIGRNMIVNNDEAWLFDHNRQEIVGLAVYAHEGTFHILFGHCRLDDTKLRASTIGRYEFQWPDGFLGA